MLVLLGGGIVVDSPNGAETWLIPKLLRLLYSLSRVRYSCYLLVLGPHSIVPLVDVDVPLHSGLHPFQLLRVIDNINGLREQFLQLFLSDLHPFDLVRLGEVVDDALHEGLRGSDLLVAFVVVLREVGQEGIAIIHLLQELAVLLALDIHERLLVVVEDGLDLLDEVVLGLAQPPPLLADLPHPMPTFDS